MSEENLYPTTRLSLTSPLSAVIRPKKYVLFGIGLLLFDLSVFGVSFGILAETSYIDGFITYFSIFLFFLSFLSGLMHGLMIHTTVNWTFRVVVDAVIVLASIGLGISIFVFEIGIPFFFLLFIFIVIGLYLWELKVFLTDDQVKAYVNQSYITDLQIRINMLNDEINALKRQFDGQSKV